MLHAGREFDRYRALGAEGKIGNVADAYFDEKTWTVRYLLVDVNGQCDHRQVLVSAIAIGEFERNERTIDIELTREQINHGPPVDTQQAVWGCRQRACITYRERTASWEHAPLAAVPWKPRRRQAGTHPGVLCADHARVRVPALRSLPAPPVFGGALVERLGLGAWVAASESSTGEGRFESVVGAQVALPQGRRIAADTPTDLPARGAWKSINKSWNTRE